MILQKSIILVRYVSCGVLMTVFGAFAGTDKGPRDKNADVVESAGGAKALASPAGPERDFVLTQIKLSVKLHGTKKTILMLHMDCGGYGGSGTFNNDRDAEMKHHDAELSAARAFLLREIPEMEVECLIADFDGLYTAGEKQQ